jgi:hypothetical protein
MWLLGAPRVLYLLDEAAAPSGSQRPGMFTRLVASAFLPNPLNLSEINHEDGDKTNNVASNLS